VHQQLIRHTQRTHTRTYTHTHTHTRTHARTCISNNNSVRTFKYTYTHTHTHTHNSLVVIRECCHPEQRCRIDNEFKDCTSFGVRCVTTGLYCDRVPQPHTNTVLFLLMLTIRFFELELTSLASNSNFSWLFFCLLGLFWFIDV